MIRALPEVKSQTPLTLPPDGARESLFLSSLPASERVPLSSPLSSLGRGEGEGELILLIEAPSLLKEASGQ